MTLQLSRDHRVDIDTTLSRFLEMKESDREEIIRSIESGMFCVFGYGSLMGDPHADFDEEFAAFITGHRRDAAFSDRHFRGTPDKLGITMGLVPTQNPEDRVHGLVRVVRFQEADGSSNYVGRVRHSLRALFKRETSFNPIYEYQARTAKVFEGEVQAIKDRFGEVTGIVCGTNIEHPQYIGPAVETPDAKRLSKWQKAAIMATSIGSANTTTTRRTGMAYWRFALNDQYRYAEIYGVPPDPHIVELVQIANAFRSMLSVRMLDTLAIWEQRTLEERKDFDDLVFTVNREAFARVTNSEQIGKLYRQARRKMGRGDPLPADRLVILEQRMRELADEPNMTG